MTFRKEGLVRLPFRQNLWGEGAAFALPSTNGYSFASILWDKDVKPQTLRDFSVFVCVFVMLQSGTPNRGHPE